MSQEQLEEALLDVDAEVRRRAVLHATSELSGPPLGDLLMRALGDGDWRVRKEAAQAILRRTDDLALLDPLVAALCQGENVGLRNAALDVLEELGERAAPALVAALPTAPEHARKFVIEALGEAGGPLVLHELKQAAISGDVNLAGEAIEALARIGGPEAEAVIRSRLSAADPFLRLASLEALHRMEVTLSWEELAPLIEDRLLRRVAVAALGRTGRIEALAPLLSALEDPALPTVGAAATALVRLLHQAGAAHPSALDSLRALGPRARAGLSAALASAAEPEVRRAVAELLAYVQDEGALPQILTQVTLDAASPETLEALRAWGERAIEPLLSLSAGAEGPEERAVALELAADLAAVASRTGATHARVREALRGALGDHEPAVVAAAARSLPPYVEASDAPALVACVLSTDSAVARAATRPLEVLVATARSAVERAVREVQIETAQAAALASVLGMLGGAEALERLRVLLTSDDADVRKAALQALGRIGGAPAAQLVALALADENSNVQVAAAHVLGRLRDEQGTVIGASELMLAVQSEHAHVRAAVARALGSTGLARAVEPLRELLRDPDSGVAIAAVDALGHLPDASLASGLGDALLHPDREVVKAALRALGSAHDPSAPMQLTAALTHEAWDVRQLAAELIGELRVRSAEPALAAQLARESDDLARDALSEALRALAEEVR